MQTQAAGNVVATEPSWLEPFGNHGQPGGFGAVVEHLDSGLVRVQLPEGVRITAAHAMAICEQLIAAFAGEPRALLLSLNGVGSIDRAAMTGYAESVTVTALALVGRTPVDRVVASKIVGITSPRCPSRYFPDAAAAITWLRAHRDAGRGQAKRQGPMELEHPLPWAEPAASMPAP